jgi:hypothetical protein
VNKRSRMIGMGIAVGVLCVVLAMTVACGKKNAAEQAFQMAKEMSKGMSPQSEQNDYTKPYLTEAKMEKFVESLKESMNPFDVVLKGGQTQSLMGLKDKMEEFNSYAKKYGFNDYYDYMAVWGRITVGEMMIAAKDMEKGTVEMLQNSIKTAEESLKKPDLMPEMKTMYEEQIASSKKSIEEMQKPSTDSSSLNESDLALVRKFKAQIEEATKKFKDKQPTNN